MGGVGVSRARRVRCGAVLLPSRLLPFSSAAFVCRRSLPPRVRGRALTFHTFPHVLYGRRPCLFRCLPMLALESRSMNLNRVCALRLVTDPRGRIRKQSRGESLQSQVK